MRSSFSLRRIIGATTAVTMVLGSGCGAKHTAAPTAFVTYKAPDNAFTCAQPSGWATTTVSSEAVMSGVLFKQGAAKIDITSDLAGSLAGDVAKASNAQTSNLEGMLPPGMNLPPQKPPVEALHEKGKKAIADDFTDYQEQPAQTFTSPLGEARLSEWTANGGLMTGKLHGYRITILGNERRFVILCQCTDSDWPVLKPTFAHVVGSLAPGS